jgi:hypothetical protein
VIYTDQESGVALEQEFGPRHKNKEEAEKENRKTYINKSKIFLANMEVEWIALLV